MTRTVPCRIDDGPRRPALGLVVLQVDETVEDDFRALLPAKAASIHVSRVPSGRDLTPDTIAGMEAALPAAAALMPPGARLAVLAYACTSATAQFGASRVADLLRAGAPADSVTDPFTAACAAFARLGAGRIGLVTPYVGPVAGTLAAAFAGAGLDVGEAVSFGERSEARVARIAQGSVEAAARAVAGAGAEAVFLSCTNLPTLAAIPRLEAALGLPVVSSNLALAWHMASLAGVALAPSAPGRLTGP